MEAKDIITQVLAMSDIRAGKVLKYVFSEIVKGGKFTMSIFEEAIIQNGVKRRISVGLQPTDEKGKEFERFRQLYPGTKRGFATEYGNFQRKHEDWMIAIPKLVGAITAEMEWHRHLKKVGAFCPEYKNMQTWINQRCWEQVLNKDQMQNGKNRNIYANASNALDAIQEVLRDSEAG